MSDQKKSYTAECKLKVVLESLQRDTTQEAVCKQYGISSSMLHRWRKEFQMKAADIFIDKRDPKQKAISQGYAPGESPDDLKTIIGNLTVQNEILKKCRGCWGTNTGTKGGAGESALPSQRRLCQKARGRSAVSRPWVTLYSKKTSTKR
jgi:transposase-like protein